jgi:hypothetical protein
MRDSPYWGLANNVLNNKSGDRNVIVTADPGIELIEIAHG